MNILGGTEMLTINNYLDNILVDFEEYIHSGVKLCDLKDVRYDAGNPPDYSNIHIQQLYLLRYAYAYAFEYKYMYKTLFSRANFDNSIAVTSVGCGSMLDYWSLASVAPPTCKIRYRGVDTINWGYQMEARAQDDVRFICHDAVDFLLRTPSLSSNVYIFPKSVSEFSKYQISQIGKLFGEKISKGQTVFLMFSLRTDKGSRKWDMTRTNILFNAMLDNGFRSDDRPNIYYHFPDQWRECRISDVDKNFRRPNRLIDLLVHELHTSCIGYRSTGKHCGDDCERRLSWWPILTCKHANYQIFEFRKEA